MRKKRIRMNKDKDFNISPVGINNGEAVLAQPLLIPTGEMLKY